MPYPEYLTAPMRGEMTDMGARELRTAAAVDDVVKNSTGVVMMVVNSVCGCAAGKARPGIARRCSTRIVPDVLATVFAGADIEPRIAHESISAVRTVVTVDRVIA
jgi:putative YphP/YqiW family bacilliredoxin